MINIIRRLVRVFKRPSEEEIAEIVKFVDPWYYSSRYLNRTAGYHEVANHYLKFGWKKGYDPSPWFSTSAYLERNPDVERAEINPLTHYLLFGKSEGRVVYLPKQLNVDEGQKEIGNSEITTKQQSGDYQRTAARFDVDFYCRKYRDVCGTDAELFDHYMDIGWKENRDPCPTFSTSFYLAHNKDIREAGLNPFQHYVCYGECEKRAPIEYQSLVSATKHSLLITAIVPNFNHARYIETRINSILQQERPPDELIILDDGSTDNSIQIIESIIENASIPVRRVYNKSNSGNVFKQWERGITLAKGDLIWICESDDFCDLNFLQTLTPYFSDPSIMIAFCRIEFSDEEGNQYAGMDGYRESSAPGIWNQPHIASAANWFNNAFAVRNIIVNVGGCLIRKQSLSPQTWNEAQKFNVCGDWFLYMQFAQGGRIAFSPLTTSYFRQHGKNTSVTSFNDLEFYREHEKIAFELRNKFSTSNDRLCSLYQNVRNHYLDHFSDEKIEDFHSCFNLNKLVDNGRQTINILIGILGFSTGGGEIFPIILANELVNRGHIVSLFVLDPGVGDKKVRHRLDSKIAVYERPLVDEIGLNIFFQDSKIDLIHTHFIGLDLWLLDAANNIKIPHIVTHHGSYECLEVSEKTLESLLQRVDQWIYIAEKNLEPFNKLPLDMKRFTKLPNAVPNLVSDFPFSRQDLDIEKEAFVFGLASRALKSKGWLIAGTALQKLKVSSGRPIYLILCGEGDEYEEISVAMSKYNDVRMLGYQENITAFYRICDCCLFPTRFPGESFPLTILESLQAGKPIIATEIGEIGNILCGDSNNESAGILIPNSDDDVEFTYSVLTAMSGIMHRETYEKLCHRAKIIGKEYSLSKLTSQYEDVYKTAILELRHKDSI